MARQITDVEKRELLNLKKEDITLDLLKLFFAATKSKPKKKFEPNDRFILNRNEYYNSNSVTTTVGRFIINKFILEPNIIKKIGYCNDVLDSKGISKLDEKVTDLRLKNEIDVEVLYQYFNDMNWLAYAPTYFLIPSLNTEMFIIDKEVKKEKERLIKENKESIINPDPNKIGEIESKLLKMSKEKLKDKPSLDLFNSGSRGSFGNNYKNTVLCRGAIVDFTNPSKFHASMASLVEGIPKEDLAKYANVSTAGSFARAKNTETGGYIAKLIRSAFQHVIIDKDLNDCGTKKVLKLKLLDSYKKFFYNRYIVEKGKLIELTKNNIGNYIDKEIHLRSPLYCLGDKYCKTCASKFYEMIEINNVGILADVIAGVILNKSMKLFHDSTIKTIKLNCFDFIKEIK